MEEWAGIIFQIALSVLAVSGAIRLLILSLSSGYGKLITQLREQNEFQAKQISKLQNETHVIWDFQMRRPQVEVLFNHHKVEQQQRGVGKPHIIDCKTGSEELPPHVQVILHDISDSLRAIYRSFPPGTPEQDIMLAIEDKHGEWIANQLCSVHNFTHGECLIYALSVAKS